MLRHNIQWLCRDMVVLSLPCLRTMVMIKPAYVQLALAVRSPTGTGKE